MCDIGIRSLEIAHVDARDALGTVRLEYESEKFSCSGGSIFSPTLSPRIKLYRGAAHLESGDREILCKNYVWTKLESSPVHSDCVVSTVLPQECESPFFGSAAHFALALPQSPLRSPLFLNLRPTTLYLHSHSTKRIPLWVSGRIYPTLATSRGICISPYKNTVVWLTQS